MNVPVREGELLAGKYRVERVLGEGGMGVVVAATHVQLDQRVAIKFLLAAALGNPEVVARFAREARAAAKIHSEHVARVIDVGTLESGAPYIVMEYLEGYDLARTLSERGPLPIEEAVQYIAQACEAVAEAHAAGIVHRDLKPANLFLAHRPDKIPIVKVLDFGISKAVAGGSATDGLLTKTSAVMGSPFYMSPEQMTAAKNVDPRTDIWALGVILFELLAGNTPFNGETMPEVVAAILQNKPPPLQSFRPDVPPYLVNVIATCMQSSPDYRYPNVAELAGALAGMGSPAVKLSAERISRVLGAPRGAYGLPTHQEFLPSAVTTGVNAGVKTGPSQTTGNGFRFQNVSQPQFTATESQWSRTDARPRSSRPLIWGSLIGVVLIAVLGAGVTLAFRHKSGVATAKDGTESPVSAGAAGSPSGASALPSTPGQMATATQGTPAAPGMMGAPGTSNAVAAGAVPAGINAGASPGTSGASPVAPAAPVAPVAPASNPPSSGDVTGSSPASSRAGHAAGHDHAGGRKVAQGEPATNSPPPSNPTRKNPLQIDLK